jgi:hypothetical protein
MLNSELQQDWYVAAEIIMRRLCGAPKCFFVGEV